MDDEIKPLRFHAEKDEAICTCGGQSYCIGSLARSVEIDAASDRGISC